MAKQLIITPEGDEQVVDVDPVYDHPMPLPPLLQSPDPVLVNWRETVAQIEIDIAPGELANQPLWLRQTVALVRYLQREVNQT